VSALIAEGIGLANLLPIFHRDTFSGSAQQRNSHCCNMNSKVRVHQLRDSATRPHARKPPTSIKRESLA